MSADPKKTDPETVGSSDLGSDSCLEPGLELGLETPPPAPDPQEVAASPTGLRVIAAYLRTLPGKPGVYRMMDRAGEVIYVGKARNLKARVASYARSGGHTERIALMISLTNSMEFVTVHTEAEALLLEANLIKRFRPRFNVVLRDDKSFPSLLITRDHEAPQLLKHRGGRARKGDYFGPFASAGAVAHTLSILQRAFLLRTCTDSVYESRTRPCLLFQIKRCSAPCTGEISLADYAGLVEEARQFLSGRSQSVREMYQRLMQEASTKLEFEQAAKYRNRLWALAQITAGQSISAEGVIEADIFAAYQDGGATCVQVFFFRTGQNWGNRAYYPKADSTLPICDVLASFVAQFYDDKPPPRLVLLSHLLPERELLAEALTTKAGRRVDVRSPRRGRKSVLVAHASTNAREALGRRLAEGASQRALLAMLAERFSLPSAPRRIEVFDNSHISGSNAVGAMVVAGPDGWVKNQYRKFTIRSEDLAPGDDYAMMREVLTRRFKRLAESAAVHEAARGNAVSEAIAGSTADDAIPSRPDLVLIDGGAGQLAVALDVMTELGCTDIPVIGVAKGPDRDSGREHFHTLGQAKSLMLEPRDPALYFVQRLRDEAHRFVIGAHRDKRSKSLGANPLDEIAGIGPNRRRALLTHFGSAKAVSRAGVEELMGVAGVSAEMARKIYAFFHDGTG